LKEKKEMKFNEKSLQSLKEDILSKKIIADEFLLRLTLIEKICSKDWPDPFVDGFEHILKLPIEELEVYYNEWKK
jgi:hypothetical protein